MAKKGKGWKVGVTLAVMLLIATAASLSDLGNAIVAYWENKRLEGDMWLIIGLSLFVITGIVERMRG